MTKFLNKKIMLGLHLVVVTNCAHKGFAISIEQDK